MTKRIIIIGCGFAGAAAAVACAERGMDVHVLEARRHIGGRTYSFHDDDFDAVLDNGQHLFMGCYHSTLKLLRTLGTDRLLDEQKNFYVDFFAANRRQSSLSSGNLYIGSLPLGLLSGIIRSNHFTVSEKFHLVRGANAIRSMRYDNARELTITQLLDKLHQPRSLREKFWDPFVYAVMNNNTHNACAALLVEVFHRAFFASTDDSHLLISRVGLSELLAPLDSFLKGKHSVIEYGKTVQEIRIESGRATGVALSTGEFLPCDAVITATPAHQLARLLPQSALSMPPFNALEQFVSSPIVSIYFLLDRKVMDDEFAGSLGTTVQWIFNRTKIHSLGGKRQLLSFVISAAPYIAELSAEEIKDICLRDLHSVLPESRKAVLLQWKVIKEKHATFVCFPHVEALRPDVATPISNLFLAGDWTNTKLPATIEGASQSGYAAANAVVSLQ
ncbi:MAG TPA: hydroxysqualene dehydroxylase HpnE [Candidatus Kapabacteria bacterium]|nr:hydroxysqualene dehydroxylase HpnE [Candidatus Kapabacteria bacterium]